MDLWHNVFLLAFVVWPLVVLLAAGLNMLISWTFSWQELVCDYLIGVVIGLCFFYGTTGGSTKGFAQVSGVEHFFLMVSIGLFGLLKWLGVEAMQDPATLFWASSLSIVGATAVSVSLDRLAIQVIGSKSCVCNGLLSLLIVGIKAPFGLITTAVGTLIGIIGLTVACATKNGGFGFIGGVFYTEWGLSGTHATTFSSYVNIFRGKTSDTVNSTTLISHELYHTRQYIYMQDWLGVVYFTIAPIWGLISSATSSRSFDASKAFNASKDIGNPIEVPAYKLSW